MLNKESRTIFELGLIDIGKKILAWRNQESNRTLTEPKEFKTIADKKAHDLLCILITKVFGNVIILSEEETIISDKRPSKYWLIDPIDGTASWYDGYDGFVTQAAYIENDLVLYGAVYAPALTKLWSAKKGEGTYLNNIKLSKFMPSKRLYLIDNYPVPKRIAKTIMDQLPVDKYIECGSLGLKSCMIVDGTADLFVKDVVIRDWDIAPIIIMINELGGFVTNLDGREITLTGSFIKNNGLIVTRTSQLVSDVVHLTS